MLIYLFHISVCHIMLEGGKGRSVSNGHSRVFHSALPRITHMYVIIQMNEHLYRHDNDMSVVPVFQIDI